MPRLMLEGPGLCMSLIYCLVFIHCAWIGDLHDGVNNFYYTTLFLFLMLIRAIVIWTPLGLKNTNNKQNLMDSGSFNQMINLVFHIATEKSIILSWQHWIQLQSNPYKQTPIQWSPIWAFVLFLPLLSGQPLLGGFYPFPRGWRFHRGWNVSNDSLETSHRRNLTLQCKWDCF